VIRTERRSRWNRSSQFPIKLLRVGLAQQRSLLREQVDVERRVGELSSRQTVQPLLHLRLKLDHTFRNLLGSSTGRLHAKLAFLDRRTVLVGSMNLDPRSSNINTEIGVMVQSRELAEMVLSAFRVDSMAGVYEVKLKPDGSGVRWVAVDGDSNVEVDVDPDTNVWQRLRLMLMYLLVPEGQL